MADPKRVTVGDFLTQEELDEVVKLRKLYGPGQGFVDRVERQIIRPNLQRINEWLGQENDARYLAYMVEFACMRLEAAERLRES